MSKKKKDKQKKLTKPTPKSSVKTSASKKKASVLSTAWNALFDLNFAPKQNINIQNGKQIFWILFGLFSMYILYSAVQTGYNEDEKFHFKYQELAGKYYSSMGSNKEIMDLPMKEYGGLIDGLCNIAYSVFGLDRKLPSSYPVRHLIIGFFGLLSLLFTGLTVRRLSGSFLGGCIGLIVLFLSPRFIGHTAMNPRDLPFAAGYIMSVYFTLRFFQRDAKLDWIGIIGLILGMGITLGVRSGGLLVFIYLWMFAFIYLLFYLPKNPQLKVDKADVFKFLGITTAGGFLFAYAFWPYGLEGPIENFIASLKSFSNYHTVLNTLFKGQMILSSEIPTFDYVATWHGIGNSLIALIGFFAFFLFLRGILNRSKAFYITIVSFALFFPFVYILYKGSNLYSGMRHTLFFVPCLVVLSATAWEFILNKYWDQKSVKIGSLVLMGLLSIYPLKHLITNPTVTYVFFNPLVGGPENILGYYELDYWGVSVKQAVKYLEQQELIELDNGLDKKMDSNYPWTLHRYTIRENHVNNVGYSRYRERFNKSYDYGVYVNNFIDGAQLRNPKWPSKRAMHQIEASGVPVCIIYDMTDKTAMNAYAALQANDLNTAVTLFNQEIEKYPTNDLAYLGLGAAYSGLNNIEESTKAYEKGLALNNGSIMANINLMMNLANTGKLNEAEVVAKNAIDNMPKNPNLLYYMAVIQLRKGNLRLAEDYLIQSLNMNPNNKQGYLLGEQIYTRMGNTARAKEFKAMAGK